MKYVVNDDVFNDMLLTVDELIAQGDYKFYRLTNEVECHHGFQYKTGLNIDTIPFNPQGECEPGGLYFFREDQLNEMSRYLFNSSPVWIREVTFPPDAKIWKMDGKYKADKFILGERKSIYDDDVVPKNELLKFAAMSGNVKVVDDLLQDVNITSHDDALMLASRCDQEKIVKRLLADPRITSWHALRTATEYGYIDIVTRLLADSRLDLVRDACTDDVYDPFTSALETASEFGHGYIVRLLLADPRVDPSTGNHALCLAIKTGHFHVVEALLADPRVDPSVDDDCKYPIVVAVISHHLSIIKLLLDDPRVDPSVNSNRALVCAAEDGDIEVVNLLLADPRVDPSARYNYILQRASQLGHFGIVKRLLADPRGDPTRDNSRALSYAAGGCHFNVVEALLEDDRTNSLVLGTEDIRNAIKYGYFSVAGRLLLAHLDAIGSYI